KTVENYRHLVTNQSIVSLAYEPHRGLIFGGSGNYGGGGSHPAEPEAKFFAFDPKSGRKIFERALVPGAVKYPATFATAGTVYTTAGDKLLVVDPASGQVLKMISLPGAQVDISLAQDSSGRLVGLTTKGVYRLAPDGGE